MREVLLVGAGGFVGAAARYVVAGWMLAVSGQDRFPVGTLAVNLAGCALIGAFAGLAQRWPGLDGELRLLLVTGVLGGFTTFSAFGIETMTLLRRGDAMLAAVYVAASVLLGLAAVWLGLRTAALR